MCDFSLKENYFALKEINFPLKGNEFPLKENLRYNVKISSAANHIIRYINGKPKWQSRRHFCLQFVFLHFKMADLNERLNQCILKIQPLIQSDSITDAKKENW